MHAFTRPNHSSRLTGLALLLLMAFVSYSIMAQDVISPTSPYGCTGLVINDVDESGLTKQEKLDMLEGAFFDSVDRYSECMDRVQTNMAKSSGSGSAASSSGDDAAVNGRSSNGTNRHNGQKDTNEEPTQKLKQFPRPKTISQDDTPPRGAPDQVIPPQDNDSIICKILYDEIANESDQATKSGLIKQYDQYDCGE